MSLTGKSLTGKFVLARVAFAEGDGRYKVRPALVIAERKMGGQMFYLLAPKYSAIEKCRGENEVILNSEEATKVGADHEGVIRFNRENLVAVEARSVLKILGHYSILCPLKRAALQHAAQRAHCNI